MLKKGFTLIELLVVITIISILAGAAMPYVQDYIEDARIARARTDMNEIKKALIRYEIERGACFQEKTIDKLVGPYLDKAIADPWGQPYCIAPKGSVVFSKGPDRESDYHGDGYTGGASGSSADDVWLSFRPPLALSKAYWVDADGNSTPNSGDWLKLRFTRPFDENSITADSIVLVTSEHGDPFNGSPCTPVGVEGFCRELKVGLPSDVSLIIGSDTLICSEPLRDLSSPPFQINGGKCKNNEVLIQALNAQ